MLTGVLGYSFGALTQLVIMLFILFFLYRDQEMAIAFTRSVLPLSDDETGELLESLRLTIYATALGRLALAAIEGVLAGAAFWVLGVPNTMLWTLATVIVGILPAVGASVVWIPIALFLGFTGHWGKAALLAAWGIVVISSIDNFLYPVLVGSKLSQHTVGILLAILGGVVIFGLSGVILGPLAFTIASTLLDFWRRRNNALPSHVSP
jgi:predicted PurR-regulated permease PerM